MKATLLLVLALVIIPGCSYIFPPSNQPPRAYITSIVPTEVTEGESVVFTGHGTDVDGQVVGYRWRSDLDGELSRLPSFESDSLSVGNHSIFFMVQDNNDAWSAEARDSVKVLAAVAAPATVNSFSASLSSIDAGDNVTLSWNVSDAMTISINQGIGAVPAVGSKTVTPATTTTYRITAIGGGATATADVTVVVRVPEQDLEILYFEADPEAVLSGAVSTLRWSTTGASEVTILPIIGTVDAEGSVNVTLTGEQVYSFTLVATDGEDTVTADVQVLSYLLMPTLHEITLTADMSRSGYVRSTGAPWANYVYVGDDNNSIGIQGFVTFDIADIPGDALITDVVVDLSNRESTYGTPFADLGCLRAYAHDYGTLDGGDYVFEPFAEPVIGLWCSHAELDTPGGGVTTGFRNVLQNKVGDELFQIRLQFALATDNDDGNDLLRWYGSKVPKLVVTYYSFD